MNPQHKLNKLINRYNRMPRRIHEVPPEQVERLIERDKQISSILEPLDKAGLLPISRQSHDATSPSTPLAESTPPVAQVG